MRAYSSQFQFSPVFFLKSHECLTLRNVCLHKYSVTSYTLLKHWCLIGWIKKFLSLKSSNSKLFLNEMNNLYFKVFTNIFLKLKTPLMVYLEQDLVYNGVLALVYQLFYDLVSDLAHNDQIHYCTSIYQYFTISQKSQDLQMLQMPAL